jgi:hypothetical protein
MNNRWTSTITDEPKTIRDVLLSRLKWSIEHPTTIGLHPTEFFFRLLFEDLCFIDGNTEAYRNATTSLLRGELGVTGQFSRQIKGMWAGKGASLQADDRQWADMATLPQNIMSEVVSVFVRVAVALGYLEVPETTKHVWGDLLTHADAGFHSRLWTLEECLERFPNPSFVVKGGLTSVLCFKRHPPNEESDWMYLDFQAFGSSMTSSRHLLRDYRRDTSEFHWIQCDEAKELVPVTTRTPYKL